MPPAQPYGVLCTVSRKPRVDRVDILMPSKPHETLIVSPSSMMIASSSCRKVEPGDEKFEPMLVKRVGV